MKDMIKSFALAVAATLAFSGGVMAQATDEMLAEQAEFDRINRKYTDAAAAIFTDAPERISKAVIYMKGEAKDLAPRLQADLMSIEPNECFLEAYGLAWVLWGDLQAMADAKVELLYMNGIIAMFAKRMDDDSQSAWDWNGSAWEAGCDPAKD